MHARFTWVTATISPYKVFRLIIGRTCFLFLRKLFHSSAMALRSHVCRFHPPERLSRDKRKPQIN